MSKLNRVKGWMTVKESASSLSGLIGEAVAESDIYHLAMRGELRLSVFLIGECFAQRGQIVDEKDISWTEMPSLHKLGETLRIPDGTHIGGNSWIKFDETILRISGIHCLPMIGGEVIEIERRYHLLTESPEVEYIYLNGVFVCNKEKTLFYKLHDWRESGKGGRFYFPLASLPDALSIVVTTECLDEVANRLNGLKAIRPDSDKLPPRTAATIYKEYRAMAETIAKLSSKKAASLGDLASVVIDECEKAGYSMPVELRTVKARLEKG